MYVHTHSFTHSLYIYVTILYTLSKIQIKSECRKHSFLMADSITKISGWHPISISKLIKIIPSICQFPIIWQLHACLEKWMGLAGPAWWCGVTRQAHRSHHNAIFSRQASNTSVTSHRHHCIMPTVHKCASYLLPCLSLTLLLCNWWCHKKITCSPAFFFLFLPFSFIHDVLTRKYYTLFVNEKSRSNSVSKFLCYSASIHHAFTLLFESPANQVEM